MQLPGRGLLACRKVPAGAVGPIFPQHLSRCCGSIGREVAVAKLGGRVDVIGCFHHLGS